MPSSVHFNLIVGKSTVGAEGDSGIEEEGVDRENLVRMTSCLLAYSALDKGHIWPERDSLGVRGE